MVDLPVNLSPYIVLAVAPTQTGEIAPPPLLPSAGDWHTEDIGCMYTCDKQCALEATCTQ